MVKTVAARFGFPALPDRTDTQPVRQPAGSIGDGYGKKEKEKGKREGKMLRQMEKRQQQTVQQLPEGIRRRIAAHLSIFMVFSFTATIQIPDWQYFGEGGTIEEPAEK